MKVIITAVATLFLSLNAIADSNHEAGSSHLGPYMGIGLSVFNVDDDNVDFTGNGSTVFGGYRFHPYVAVEIGVGTKSVDDTVEGVDLDAVESGFSLTILPMIPINNKWDAYMAFGYEYGTIIAMSDNGVRSYLESDDAATIGAGLQWHSDNIFIRGNVASTMDDFGDLVTYGISVGVEF